METVNSIPEIELHDGNRIPQIGFGTWQVPDADVEPAASVSVRFARIRRASPSAGA